MTAAAPSSSRSPSSPHPPPKERKQNSNEGAPQAITLRDHADWRVLDGFGRAVASGSRYVAPASTEALAGVLAKAGREGLAVTFRGSGRSYGDAALNKDQLVIDTTRMNRPIAWDPKAGILETEPGLTVEGVWRRTLQDGYWPHVVPGTMAPTLGGAMAMNIHGKNNYKAGPFGEHVLDFDLVTAAGDVYRCSKTENPDIFHAALGGLGLLGAITRVRMKLKKVESGFLRVTPFATKGLDDTFDVFERELPGRDYAVGWIDCLASGSALGRGELHTANYLTAEEDPDGERSFHVERQTLPGSILGMPKSMLWMFMAPFMNDPGVRLVNALKMISASMKSGAPYFQAHVAFAFLLDYVPNWRLSYGKGGFIQYQVFLPYKGGREALRKILERAQMRGLPSYLGVLKRHRPDAFLLSHAVDGWSFAMDFKVTAGNRERLWKMTHELTEIVLDAGGRFYFAKDAVLDDREVEMAYGKERLDKFFEIKARLDPKGLFVSDLARRVFGPRL